MIPFGELMKFKPELLGEIISYPTKQISWKGGDFANQTPIDTKEPIPIPVNKVGGYCEDDEGNTTLRVEIEKLVSVAILDSGAGISIATKDIWVKWGKPAIRWA